ncbi:MAG TPA: hypothetical protein VNP04_26150 [Alphaproteobacteria bacterium]|nr:hypothetical protein [Alphaproteobacteria bacterium]
MAEAQRLFPGEPRRGRRGQFDLRLPLPSIAIETLLAATASVPWERPVHAARLAFLQRVARPTELSVHVACGTDRLGFIDAALGLTTIVTDAEAAALAVLSQQFAEFERRLGPLPGSLQLRQLAVEAFASETGFPAGEVHHLTLQNLFNAHLHPVHVQPRIIDNLLTALADTSSIFITASEAAVLTRQAPIHKMRLVKLGQIPGYYDEDVILLQAYRSAR